LRVRRVGYPTRLICFRRCAAAELSAAAKIYVAITSASEDLVRRAARDAASTGAKVIVAGTVHDLRDMEGPGVAVGDVLPSHKIMPCVDLAVTAGGQGSVQCAMASGTLLIGIPLQPEQDTNVHLLQEKGAARLLSVDGLERGRLPAIAEMQSKPRYRAAAQTLKTSLCGPQRSGALCRGDPAISGESHTASGVSSWLW
jgi:UDP:flavonoid glycosyltransferase YjiC (YdhE family)